MLTARAAAAAAASTAAASASAAFTPHEGVLGREQVCGADAHGVFVAPLECMVGERHALYGW